MAQGLGAGFTSYQGQTKDDIASDILRWLDFSKNIKKLFEDYVAELRRVDYWKNVPYSFRSYCEGVPTVCSTFIHDFDIILKDIQADQITARSIKLLRNIFDVAKDYEEQSWRTYKEDESWHEYGESNFVKAEKLYCEGRDFFCTLFDVGNAVARLEDYMKEEKQEIHNDYSTHSDNSIHIGNDNKITDSQIGSNNKKSNKDGKEPLRSKVFWKIFIPIVVGVAILAIGLWLGLSG